MPNWCENELRLCGKAEDVNKVLEFIKGEEGDFDFSTIIPYPDEYKELDKIAADWNEEAKRKKEEEGIEIDWSNRPKDGYNQGGYSWCVVNWGTKWNVGEYRLEDNSWSEDYKDVTLHFETAWSPPLPVIEALAERFPELENVTLSYFECGCAYHGYVSYENGKLTSEAEGPYYGNRGG